MKMDGKIHTMKDILEINKEYIIKRYIENCPIKELTEKFGCRDTAIYRLIKRNNIPKRRCNNRKYFLNENYFESIDEENKSYWLGFLMADGSVDKRSERVSVLTLSLNIKDKNRIEKFQKDINSSYKVYYIPKGRMSSVRY